MMSRKKIIILIFGLIILSVITFTCGWVARDKIFYKTYKPSPVRVSGFDFVKPLLICDSNPQREYPELKVLNNQLNDYINSQVTAKNIDSASVFFMDFSNDGKIDINKDETFYPASLSKLAILIAYFKMSEKDPNLLSQNLLYDMPTDYNVGQEIKPKQFAERGHIYTIEELLLMTIKYSDNNSYYALSHFADQDALNTLYKNLKIPSLTNKTYNTIEEANYITTNDISYVFRILYNSTYLTPESSDKAMQILSQVDYSNGLVAGLPKDTQIAHKFGLFSIPDDNGKIVGRELHDCGIIYNSKHPYLLCIMTKSSASIPNIENVIKNISSLVWQEVSSPQY